jgi:diguanylate cyclase (GGDEF)-like protein
MGWWGYRSGTLRLCVPILGTVAAGGALLALESVSGVAATDGGARLVLPSPTPLPSVSLTPLPSPKLPLPSPSVPNKVLPSPSLPALNTPLPSPSIPVVIPTPSPVISPLPRVSPSPSTVPPNSSSGSGTLGGTTSGSGPAGGHDPHAILTIPFTTIALSSPFDVGLAGALAVLPLLGGLWLLLFGRTWVEARRAKDARLRLMLAGELGIEPRELSSLSLKSLYKLREEAAFDELTGVMRRAAGMSALEREIARARRQKTALTVAFVDVDGLKQANDTRGHKAGDDLLKAMANALRGALRAQDLVLRYGGDEFVCVLPDTVYDAGRAKLSWVQTDAAKAGVRFSVGLAQLERADDVVSLLGRADRELYDAKARKHASRVVMPAPDTQGRRRVSA